MVLFSDPQLVDRALDDAVNSLGGDFRLIDRGHRLRGLIHLFRAQPNWAVFIPGSCTMVNWMWLSHASVRFARHR